tara:strand:- start:5923 stop:6111 length:189 start_codon:yes stop_codon:yes gene_type:complete
MGAVYKWKEPRKQKGRFIYNRGALHKAGWDKFHKVKYRVLRLEFDRLRRGLTINGYDTELIK